MRTAQLVLATAVAAGAVGFGTTAAAASTPPAVKELRGVVHLAAGACRQGRPTGSYLAVTFGTRAIRNSSSSCEAGAVTLLSPRQGLSTGRYSSAAAAVFDNHPLDLVTTGASRFTPPRLYLVGNQVDSDVRAVQARYNAGTWSIGSELATGRYHPASHRLSLTWFSGESFTPSSAGTEVHLVGRFVGTIHRVPQGATVQLGTASFAAGSAAASVENAAQQAGHAGAGPRRHHGHRLRLAASRKSSTTGSPKAFLIGEVLVLVNLVAFVALARRRGRR